MIRAFVKRHIFIFQLFALTFAYCATGKLGMFLAVPPGYATAIYPPSGIALAGILILGYRAWFGVLLGSFLMNLSIASSYAPTVE
jgi:integral membrane sensor domain MASE1